MLLRTASSIPSVAALWLVTLGLVATPAQADTPTCQGRAVTVSGNVGTDADDVMVVDVSQADTASAKAGNDLVCIRTSVHREPLWFLVDAGPGDDTVHNEASAGGTRVTATLGAGADSYVGSDVAPDTVVGGPASWSRWGDASDVEADTIDTRGEDDIVFSGSTTPGATNQDTVMLGSGDDALHWAGEQDGPAVDLGAGVQRLSVYSGWQGSAVGVDAAQGLATVDGRPALRWTGEVFAYGLAMENLAVTFTGTDARERLTLARGGLRPGQVPHLPADQRRTVDMRGGDDTVVLEHAVVGGSLAGGEGEDMLEAGLCLDARVQLGGTYWCLDGLNPRVEHLASIDAWEGIVVPTMGLAEVVGTSGTDDVTAWGDTVRMDGHGGDDTLVVDYRGYSGSERGTSVVRGGRGSDLITGAGTLDSLSGGSGDDRIDGRAGGDLLLGGGGRDLVVGGKGDDRVFGGGGRDQALGQGGTDRCRAEVTRRCERA